MKSLILLSLLLSCSLNVGARASSWIEKNQHEATALELEKVHQTSLQSIQKSRFQIQNSLVSFKFHQNLEAVPWRPAHDTSDFKYVLLSSEAGFSEAQNLRYQIAKNLPADVKLVLLVQRQQADRILQEYSKHISPDRIILARDTNIEGGFWARDSFPYPVVNEKGELSLVSTQYYRTFRSSPALASTLGLGMAKQSFTFVGGNLIADESGTCFTIDSYRLFTATPDDLRRAYGCRELHILKHFSGIGDVDEVMKPIGNKTILTNTVEYEPAFKALGYNVIMLPKLGGYRTYANSLVVGQTVFMPTYGVAADADAQKVYTDLGYQVVGIRTNQLSDDLHGSIHCQTMAYPAMNEELLLQALELEKIN